MLEPGPAVATRPLPLRDAPDGAATGLVVANGELVTITGPPVVADGQYWYPVMLGTTNGYVGAGTGSDPWLVPAPVPTPPSTARPAPATQTTEPAAGDASQPLQQAPNIGLVSAGFGIVLLAVVAWWAIHGSSVPSQGSQSEDWICRDCRAVNRRHLSRCHACSRPAADVAVPLSEAHSLAAQNKPYTGNRRPPIGCPQPGER